MDWIPLLLAAALGALVAGLLVFLWPRRAPDFSAPFEAQTQQLRDELTRLRQEQGTQNQQQRTELAQSIHQFAQTISAPITQSVGLLTESNAQRLGELRHTLEARIKDLQTGNEQKLDAMRATVEEKLQSTLDARLGASFKLVSERLEQVHKGLGEMQGLAGSVGDLKRVLTNVKTRGIFGEMQLAALLEQVLTPEQYASNIATKPGSNDRVEFAIRLPGRGTEAPVWLPIDAKFPREDYERLLDAQDRADPQAAEAAAQALESRVRGEAKTIAGKYLSPPQTTDFALLFLPTEGLYAEILRRPGLFENLQREYRVTVCGPTNLLAFLNSLQMGFRTLAIEQRSSEVWQVLGAVKTEFGRFGEVLDKVRKKLDEATSQIDATGVRSRAIERKLKGVEALPGTEAEKLLGAGEAE